MPGFRPSPPASEAPPLGPDGAAGAPSQLYHLWCGLRPRPLLRHSRASSSAAKGATRGSMPRRRRISTVQDRRPSPTISRGRAVEAWIQGLRDDLRPAPWDDEFPLPRACLLHFPAERMDARVQRLDRLGLRRGRDGLDRHGADRLGRPLTRRAGGEQHKQNERERAKHGTEE